MPDSYLRRLGATLTKLQQLGQEYDLETPQACRSFPGLRLSETAEDTPRLAASSPVRAESPQKDGVGGAFFSLPLNFWHADARPTLHEWIAVKRIEAAQHARNQFAQGEAAAVSGLNNIHNGEV